MNSSVIGNLMHSMLKKLRVDHIATSPIEIGCQFEELHGRLEDMFKVPTPEEALVRLMSKCAQCLKARYANRESFHLPKSMAEFYLQNEGALDNDTNNLQDEEGTIRES